MTAFFQIILSAFLAGTSCSICGASTGTAFLSVYVLTHRKMIVPSLFYLAGKTLVTVAFCLISSLLGFTILGSSGLLGTVDVYLIGQILAADHNQFTAASAGVIFSVTGFISPALIWLIVSRLLSAKLVRDVGRYIPIFQLECYIILFGISVYAIVKHLI